MERVQNYSAEILAISTIFIPHIEITPAKQVKSMSTEE